MKQRPARLTALVSAVLGMILLAMTLSTVVGSAGAGSSTPIGIYRGPGPWGASEVGAYEGFVGRDAEYILDYQDIDTWANQEWPDWQANAWRPFGNAKMVLGSTGIFPTGGSWAQAASGAYDQHWLTLGQRLVSTGQENAVLRGAHEFNGDWFHYGVDQGEVQDFIVSWRRWVDIMRSVPGQQFTFDWNPSVGINPGLAHAEVAYPGDQWVDRIALDVYDGWYNRGWAPGSQQPSQAERDVVWDDLLNGPRGMNYWRSFANAHGKHMSLPEWGLELWTVGDGLIHGGGDNPSFISRMSAIINDPAWNIDYHAFWEQRGYGVMDPDSDSARIVAVPQSRAVFLAQLGGAAAPLPQVTTPTAPVTQIPGTTLGTLPPLPTSTGPVDTTPSTATTSAPSSTVPTVPTTVTTTAPAPPTTTPTTGAPTTTVPAPVTTVPDPAPGSNGLSLVRAIDLGGPDHQWETRPYAAHDGQTPVTDFTTNGLVSCVDPASVGTPPDDVDLAELVRCGLAKDPQQPDLALTFTNLAPGNYEVVFVTTDPAGVTGMTVRPTALVNGSQRRLEKPTTDGGWWMRRRPWKLEITGTSLELTFPDQIPMPTIAAIELWQKSS